MCVPTEVGLRGFEQVISCAVIQVVGEPIIIGIMILGFFAAFVMLQNQRLDGMVLILVPGGLLSLAFLPSWLIIFYGLGCTILLYAAIRKKGGF